MLERRVKGPMQAIANSVEGEIGRGLNSVEEDGGDSGAHSPPSATPSLPACQPSVDAYNDTLSLTTHHCVASVCIFRKSSG
jgi:hypothetical protein